MELQKHITDEKTGIGYTLCGDNYGAVRSNAQISLQTLAG